MAYHINPLVERVAAAPIAEAQSWIRGRRFPAERPLLDCAQAVPSYAPAEELTRHLAEAVRKPQTAFYTDILGREDLRTALARHLSTEYRGRIAPDQVGITAGCNQAFCLAAAALAGVGEEVILPLPFYFNYQMWVEMLGISLVPLPVGERDALPDPEAAARLITRRTRAIVLISPNNPTGASYPGELIAAVPGSRLAADSDPALQLLQSLQPDRISRRLARRRPSPARGGREGDGLRGHLRAQYRPGSGAVRA
jgi:aspartate/methionine/tyrosine aminotransferase